ncbi:MAG: hypothetical protein AAGA66_20045 [Bacteroidota bacterium]
MMMHAGKQKIRPFGYLISLICSLSLVLSNCEPNREFADQQALSAYLYSHDAYHQEADVGATKLAVTYRPTDLILAKEITPRTTPEALAEKRQEYRKYVYFQLALTYNEKEWLQQQVNNPVYGDLVRTLSFRMGQYIDLITPSDTIPPVSVYHDRMYGLSKATQLLLAFPRSDLPDQAPLQLIINEFGGSLGRQEFVFQAKDLLNEPFISFKNQ